MFVLGTVGEGMLQSFKLGSVGHILMDIFYRLIPAGKTVVILGIIGFGKFFPGVDSGIATEDWSLGEKGSVFILK